MHISLDGFGAGTNGEMNWIKVDEEIFDRVGKRISEGDTVTIAGCPLSPAGGKCYNISVLSILGWIKTDNGLTF